MARKLYGKPHNYIAKLTDFINANPLPAGKVTEVDVLHDDWCGVWRGKRCNCNPDVVRRESKT